MEMTRKQCAVVPATVPPPEYRDMKQQSFSFRFGCAIVYGAALLALLVTVVGLCALIYNDVRQLEQNNWNSFNETLQEIISILEKQNVPQSTNTSSPNTVDGSSEVTAVYPATRVTSSTACTVPPDPSSTAATDTTRNLLDVIAADEQLTSFLAMVLENDVLVNSLNSTGNYTVFAPINEAFDDLPSYYNESDPESVYKMHVAKGTLYKTDMLSPTWNEHVTSTLLSDRKVRGNQYSVPSRPDSNEQIISVNGRQVIDFNYTASNGVLHKISQVMASVYNKHSGNIGTELNDHATSDNFEIALSLLNASGLMDEISSQPSYSIATCFIPTDDAFQNLPTDLLTSLQTNATAAKTVMSYHIVKNSTWYTVGLYDGLELPTLLQGHSLRFSSEDNETLIVNNSTENGISATFVEADRSANNGAWHLISQVLLPPQI